MALIPWLFFQSSVSNGAGSIIAQKDLVKKIYFPREVIPISYVTGCFVNMLLCFIIVFAVALISGVHISILGLLCLPLVMIVEYFFALGITLLVSAITVYFRDLEHIMSIITMAWMYVTPIVYQETLVPDRFMKIYRFEKFKRIISKS